MVTEPPDYQWVCQRCKADNAAHTRNCKGCGFSAAYTVADLAEVQGQMKPVGFTRADVPALVGTLAFFLAWLALFHDNPLIMLLGAKLFILGGIIVAAILGAALQVAYDFIVALLKR